MRLRIEQLAPHVARGLAPVYLVSGDEPLQVEEACDAIRAATRAQGYHERIVFQAATGFDWSALAACTQNLSLFAERKLIELRLPTGKPGEAGGAALAAYAAQPASDTVLLVICPKLDAATQKSKWVNALDAAGVMLQVWPVEARQLPEWISRRLTARGLKADKEAVALLAERVEGNLLACAQDIEKLYLLYGNAEIDVAAVAAAVADNARFDIYALVDSALAGDGARSARILEGLRAEGVDPVLVLWALAREVRVLARMAYDCATGSGVDQVLASHKVWEKRKGLVRAGLMRHKVRAWQRLLLLAARIERIIKGALPGSAWDELLRLALGVGGVRLFAGVRV
ncbi:MAG: DNA polymerase III subunit delta [Gammaproteobacteria bacterium]|nr:DNA polymerase III subunit delta [Gammaproteobacteria bacterium]